MKAFVLERYGKKRALRSADMPTPELRDDEVLVEVHAAGVNLLDSKIRDGEFKLILPYRLPLILGHDVAGVVVKVGPRVRQFKPGDEVYARPDDFRIGTFAEFVPVKEASLALKPKGLTMEEAASIPLVGLTAWQALVEKANLKKGQKVFIQAGSGGVGTFAIQLAKHLGATVATTTSTANVALVKSLGADVVIDYKTQDFEDVLRDYDVVLNSQDGKTLEKSLRVLKGGGKLISISGPPDPEFGKEIAAPGFVKLVMRLLSSGVRRKAQGRGIGYSFLFMKANGSQLREITRLIEAGAIRPVIDRGLPVRVDQRGPGLRRSRPREGQGRRQGEMTPPRFQELSGTARSGPRRRPAAHGADPADARAIRAAEHGRDAGYGAGGYRRDDLCRQARRGLAGRDGARISDGNAADDAVGRCDGRRRVVRREPRARRRRWSARERACRARDVDRVVGGSAVHRADARLRPRRVCGAWRPRRGAGAGDRILERRVYRVDRRLAHEHLRIGDPRLREHAGAVGDLPCGLRAAGPDQAARLGLAGDRFPGWAWLASRPDR